MPPFPEYKVFMPESHPRVMVLLVVSALCALKIARTSTGAHPVHCRPVIPGYAHVHDDWPLPQLPAPEIPQFRGHLSTCDHAAAFSASSSLRSRR